VPLLAGLGTLLLAVLTGAVVVVVTRRGRKAAGPPGAAPPGGTPPDGTPTAD
jgi:hypothetical protein